MSGVELCRRIRKLENYRSTPIIFVTGVEENWGLAEAFNAGADDLISKPPNVHVIRARLKGHLQRMEYFQRLERARKVLQQYLSKRTLEVVETTSLTGTLPPPEERDLAICFTDIRDFTAFAEEMEPSKLFYAREFPACRASRHRSQEWRLRGQVRRRRRDGHLRWSRHGAAELCLRSRYSGQ